MSDTGESTSRRLAKAQAAIRGVLADIGAFDVLAFSWGASVPVSSARGTSSVSAGEASLQDLSLTRFTDETSPALLGAMLRGELLQTGSITVTLAGGRPVTYDLENVLVSSYSSGGSLGEDRLTENLSLSFSELTYTVGTKSVVWSAAGLTR